MAVAIVAFASSSHALSADASAVLRVGMPQTPTSLDPARAQIAQEFMVMGGIYDALYGYDPIARPARVVPLAAEALPQVSADYRTYTVRLRPGIYFTPHPAFGGKRRELVAADFAYAMRRVMDPQLRSPQQGSLDGRIAGLDALAKRARDAGSGLDYDAPVEGLEVVDTRTLRIRLNAPDPLFVYQLVGSGFGGVAREVVEAEGDGYGQHPVGTGPYRVESFTPGQRLVLVRNPDFRELRWEDLLSTPSGEAPKVHPMAGRRLPALDRVELFSTPEESAELLALRRGEVDLIVALRPELALDDRRLKPDLARAGIHLVRDPSPTIYAWYFSMRDPVVGGNAREKIALRRAIAMAFDDDEFIRIIDGGLSEVRQQWLPPGIEGHIAGYVNPNRFNAAAANALLDRMGFKRGADGFRRNPDGSALVVTWLIGTSGESRRRAEFTKRMLDRIGVRTAFDAAPASERVRRLYQCAYAAMAMDGSASIPDGTDLMYAFWGKAAASANTTCFRDPVFDAAYEKALVTPPGPTRVVLFRTMQTQIDAYVPARALPHGDVIILTSSRVVGPFGVMGDWLQLLTLGTDASNAPGR